MAWEGNLGASGSSHRDICAVHLVSCEMGNRSFDAIDRLFIQHPLWADLRGDRIDRSEHLLPLLTESRPFSFLYLSCTEQ